MTHVTKNTKKDPSNPWMRIFGPGSQGSDVAGIHKPRMRKNSEAAAERKQKREAANRKKQS